MIKEKFDWKDAIAKAKESGYEIDWKGELHIILGAVSDLRFSERLEVVAYIEQSIKAKTP